MNKTIYFLLLLLLTVSVNSSCTSNKLMDWRKMECGLYMSPNGDIGFATIPEQANLHNYQLKEDECPNSFLTTFDYDDTTQLKYVVDTSTFEHIGSVFYKDTNNIYSYNPMCDGGYFSVLSNDVSKFKWLDGYYFILNSNIEYFNKGEIDADYNTFMVSQKHIQLACDKDFFYSFGEKMTLEEFEKSNSEEVVEELLHLQDFIDELIIDTDTLFFSNESMLYWQWNRDSSWLTFENKEHSKTTLRQNNGGTKYYIKHLGLKFTKEHNDFLLFRYRWISGCCTPPDMILLDKNTGEEIERISNEKLIWYEWEEDYIIYFSDSLYNTITYFDLSNNTKRETKLPPNRGISALNIIIENYPYDIFQRLPKVENNYLLLEYDYQHPKFKDSLMTDVIQIKKP